MKHIVDGLGYQEACNGIKCIECPFLDEEHNCKMGRYIRQQVVYPEDKEKVNVSLSKNDIDNAVWALDSMRLEMKDDMLAIERCVEALIKLSSALEAMKGDDRDD